LIWILIATEKQIAAEFVELLRETNEIVAMTVGSLKNGSSAKVNGSSSNPKSKIENLKWQRLG
jgi:hypothetical protein